ncbi:hypothetical protein [Nonomuraea wenchangensis]|uniref:hypothetical protein n=1 Tax=Nonomuraea wenchangensis TaxID=568860 RepID=UPI00333237F9
MTVTVPQVPSSEAEAASALLFRTLGAHRAAIAAMKPQRHTRLRTMPDDDPFQDRCQATLVRLLSITEAFASEMLAREIESAVVGARNATATVLADEAVIRATSGWQDQKKAYKDWLGIVSDWKAVEQLAEARNAVAHGLGRLTKRQMRNGQSVRAKLQAAGISLHGNLVVLSDENLAEAAASCRVFIEKLDMAVQFRL